MERKMFYNASPLSFARAKELRGNLTKAEMALWEYLRTSPFGHKFRRQHPIGSYIVDFFCYKLKLVIEADGGIHEKEDVILYDKERQKWLEENGLTVLRFTNDQILINQSAVIESINLFISSIPPQGGRGWGYESDY